MKTLLLKVTAYLLALAGIYFFFASFAGGNTDGNYRHFAVEKPTNIILGDSRSSQAIVPSVLNNKLGRSFDNFSLNIVHSPYGKVYLNALKKKISPEAKEGIFILSVSPWNLALGKGITDEKDFPENSSPLTNMHFYDLQPNIEYLLKNYSGNWYHIYRDREEQGKSNAYVHKDGWLEVTVEMANQEVEKRKASKIKDYQGYAANQSLSEDRLNALEDIIDFLKPKGKVFLVRIPASEGIMKIENEKFHEFPARIQQLVDKKEVPYFDFSQKSSSYKYTDGNHMYKESSKMITAEIADSIRRYQSK